MAGEMNIGPKISLDGEKEFKAAIAGIGKDMAVLSSEMGMVTAKFADNADGMAAVTAKTDIYNKQIAEQQKKIDKIKEALTNASKEYGENSNQVKEWQIKLNNAERDMAKTETALNSLGKEAEDSGGKFEKLGGVLKGIGAAMGAVAVAAAAAAVKLGKEAIEVYAEYEQLVGGVDTLFKDSSQEVQNYAANAFKTAGMTANEYMTTVTGFSASLIQSLDGDTTEAAKIADQAITDMSDNANKMGTDISSIQNAYQGFAKQNYTMLDNLKLGYGGTKEEMERLLADAEKISGVKYDLSSFADLTEAIHVIQTEMGITGTTALEATETISGSIAGMQAAIGNLIAGLGNSNADIGMLVANVAEAFQNVLGNVTPVIENIVKALPEAIDGIIQAVAELLPTLLTTVTDLFSQVLTTILTLLPELIPAAVEALMTIVGALIDNLPLLIDAAVQLVTTLVTGIGEALPELIPAAVDAIVTIVQGLIDNLPMLLDAALQLILGLAEGLLKALPNLIKALPAIITGIVDFLLGAIPQIVEAGIDLLVALIDALPEIITEIVLAIPEIVNGIVDALMDNIPALVEAGIKLLVSLVYALPEIIAAVVEAIPKIVKGLYDAIIERKGEIADAGKNLIHGLWDGILDTYEWLKSKVKGFFDGIVGSIKDFFGISSPSKLFEEEIGKNLALGIGEGFENSMKKVSKDMTKAIPTDFNIKGGAAKSYNNSPTLNFYQPVKSPYIVAMEVKKSMQQLVYGV